MWPKVWTSECVTLFFFLHHKLFPFKVFWRCRCLKTWAFLFFFLFCAVSCTCSLWHQRPCDRLPISHDRITQSHAQQARTLANFCHESLGSLSVLRAVLFGTYPNAARGLVGNDELQKWTVKKTIGLWSRSFYRWTYWWEGMMLHMWLNSKAPVNTVNLTQPSSGEATQRSHSVSAGT